jgi:hypothetical protein
VAAIVMPTLYVAVRYHRKFLAGLRRQRMQFYFYFRKHPGAEAQAPGRPQPDRARDDPLSALSGLSLFRVVLPQATIGLGRLPDKIGEAANVSMLGAASGGV